MLYTPNSRHDGLTIVHGGQFSILETEIAGRLKLLDSMVRSLRLTWLLVQTYDSHASFQAAH